MLFHFKFYSFGVVVVVVVLASNSIIESERQSKHSRLVSWRCAKTVQWQSTSPQEPSTGLWGAINSKAHESGNFCNRFIVFHRVDDPRSSFIGHHRDHRARIFAWSNHRAATRLRNMQLPTCHAMRCKCQIVPPFALDSSTLAWSHNYVYLIVDHFDWFTMCILSAFGHLEKKTKKIRIFLLIVWHALVQFSFIRLVH